MTQQQEVRRGHPYFMYDAIMRQPEAIGEMLRQHSPSAQEVADSLSGKRRLYLVGIGTSWHAALVAQHWFHNLVGAYLSVEAWHSFEFCSYPPSLTEEDAVVVISHRGTKTYSFQALEMAQSRGSYTVSITATDPGPRIGVANAVMHTVEQERSAAFTVSYTSALAVLALLGTALASRYDGGEDLPWLRAELEEVPRLMSRVLAERKTIQDTVRHFQTRQRFVTVGWGPNTANAYEVALKIKETSAQDSEGLQVEQILHGPFCSMDYRCLITLIAPPGPGYERAMNLARAAVEVDASVWALVQEGDNLLSGLAMEYFPLPPVPECWSPLVYVVALQLFSYYLAVAKGTNPDLFRQDNPKQLAARRHYDL